MMSSLQSIVFDFDGVIADSEPLHCRAFQETLADAGIALSADEYYARYLGYDDAGLFRTLSADRTLGFDEPRVTALVERKGVRFDALLHDEPILFPGAAAFIRRAAAEVPIAIASGALQREIVAITRAAGVLDLFTTIVAAGDTPESKPSPAPYRLAFDRLRRHTGRDLDPRRTVAIEDSRWGLESARGAGLRCVGVTSSYAADALAGAELVVGGLDELTLQALDRLCTSRPGAGQARGTGVPVA